MNDNCNCKCADPKELQKDTTLPAKVYYKLEDIPVTRKDLWDIGILLYAGILTIKYPEKSEKNIIDDAVMFAGALQEARKGLEDQTFDERWQDAKRRQLASEKKE